MKDWIGEVEKMRKMERFKEHKDYLRRLERDRQEHEPLNKTAYMQARELGAYLSIAEHGNEEAANKATKLLKRWSK